MDSRKIVAIVEEKEEARIALKWALQNLVRYGDLLILLHVFPATKSSKKTRLLRLKAYQLALSFQDITNAFPNTKVEIVVAEGDEEGEKIAGMVREIGASALVLGLHDHSFLYKMKAVMTHKSIPTIFNCGVLAVKQQQQPTLLSEPEPEAAVLGSLTSPMDFSLVEIARLQVAATRVDPPPKIPYRICPNPSAIIWRTRRSKPK